MNGHSQHNHVNGQQVTRTEEEAQIDAYQEELTHEAVLDEVRVQTTQVFPLISRPFSQPKKFEFHYIENLRRTVPIIKWTWKANHSVHSDRIFQEKRLMQNWLGSSLRQQLPSTRFLNE